ncbi:hypothetical protein C8F01DRAFT_1254337 [Mycena amicta]|nr:hypothetical protein C8F01DRAFT_1254337 [Mycena amicta]
MLFLGLALIDAIVAIFSRLGLQNHTLTDVQLQESSGSPSTMSMTVTTVPGPVLRTVDVQVESGAVGAVELEEEGEVGMLG